MPPLQTLLPAAGRGIYSINTSQSVPHPQRELIFASRIDAVDSSDRNAEGAHRRGGVSKHSVASDDIGAVGQIERFRAYAELHAVRDRKVFLDEGVEIEQRAPLSCVAA